MPENTPINTVATNGIPIKAGLTVEQNITQLLKTGGYDQEDILSNFGESMVLSEPREYVPTEADTDKTINSKIDVTLSGEIKAKYSVGEDGKTEHTYRRLDYVETIASPFFINTGELVQNGVDFNSNNIVYLDPAIDGTCISTPIGYNTADVERTLVHEIIKKATNYQEGSSEVGYSLINQIIDQAAVNVTKRGGETINGDIYGSINLLGGQIDIALNKATLPKQIEVLFNNITDLTKTLFINIDLYRLYCTLGSILTYKDKTGAAIKPEFRYPTLKPTLFIPLEGEGAVEVNAFPQYLVPVTKSIDESLTDSRLMFIERVFDITLEMIKEAKQEQELHSYGTVDEWIDYFQTNRTVFLEYFSTKRINSNATEMTPYLKFFHENNEGTVERLYGLPVNQYRFHQLLSADNAAEAEKGAVAFHANLDFPVKKLELPIDYLDALHHVLQNTDEEPTLLRIDGTYKWYKAASDSANAHYWLSMTADSEGLDADKLEAHRNSLFFNMDQYLDFLPTDERNPRMATNDPDVVYMEVKPKEEYANRFYVDDIKPKRLFWSYRIKSATPTVRKNFNGFSALDGEASLPV